MRKQTILIGILVLLPAAILGGVSLISCSDLACGSGTHEERGKCISNLPSTCGEGTYSLEGRCVQIGGAICGANTTLDKDAGVCVGGGSGPGPGELRGGRWTNVFMNKPASIATIANLQLPPQFATEPVQGSTSTMFLHGGDGVLMTPDPLMYTFKEGFDVTAGGTGVISQLGDQELNDGGVAKTPFETLGEFNMRFQIVGSETDPEPPLYIWGAKLTGTVDADLIPTSNDPPLGGKLTGCFTAHGEPGKAGAADIYIKLLSETILELIESSGGVMDMDCNSSGSNNGYAFEIEWDSNEITDLTIDPGDGGVAQQDAQ